MRATIIRHPPSTAPVKLPQSPAFDSRFLNLAP